MPIAAIAYSVWNDHGVWYTARLVVFAAIPPVASIFIVRRLGKMQKGTKRQKAKS